MKRRYAPQRCGSSASPDTAAVPGSSILVGGSPGMDIRKIKKLIELLEESGIAEIEIKEGEEAVRISRLPAGGAALQSLPPVASGAALPAATAAAPAPAPAGLAGPEGAASKPKPSEHVIT